MKVSALAENGMQRVSSDVAAGEAEVEQRAEDGREERTGGCGGAHGKRRDIRYAPGTRMSTMARMLCRNDRPDLPRAQK